jgi:hypothetical protein
VWVIKKRIRWVGHEARLGREACIGFWWGNMMERDHWEDPGIDVRILEWIFIKCDVGVWNGLSWFRIEAGGRHL